ncbi:MAG: DUF4372 domain-containing protein [Gemmatimonadetes bacterium]|nr:DUF4372 domain-containing protein [Gemmatimonadota bacterium]
MLAQLLDHLPRHSFCRIVERVDPVPNRWDHFVAVAFVQFAYREGLRDIEVCLRAVAQRLYHSRLRSGPVPRSTLADANERCDWRIFAEFGRILIADARALYAPELWVTPPIDVNGTAPEVLLPGCFRKLEEAEDAGARTLT